MSDNPWEGFEPNDYGFREERAYKPSSEVIPHWAGERPKWEMSEEEFWRCQVAGRLAIMWERGSKKRIIFEQRHPSQDLSSLAIGRQLQDWINGRGELMSFTDEQIRFAESEVRKFRLDGTLPKAFSDFSRGLRSGQSMTYKEFRKANPK